MGESASLSERLGITSVELGRLDSLKLDWHEGLSVLVFGASMQVVGCCCIRFVPGWDMACKGREEFGGLWLFREERCCRS